jgi:hypothetical protein
MARDNWEAISECAALHTSLGVADTTGKDLDENFASSWLLELDVFEDEGCVFLFENGGFVRLG